MLCWKRINNNSVKVLTRWQHVCFISQVFRVCASPSVSPAEGAHGVLGLVAGVVLVLSPSHVQETVHHSHTLVEALRRQLGEMAPGGSSITRVPPQHLDTGVKGQ